ncbi:MAG TPA: hypothetical protein VNQ77_16000 [Frankiaceae bacterium]|nr:hypothetical protein [Frankiaceae bacterium]
MRAARGLLLAAVLAGALTWVYAAAFPERTDYAGHFVAGAGGTLLLLVPLLARWATPWRVVAVACVGVLLGVGTEATIFRLAEFDPVDLANQSLGGLLAAGGALDARGLPSAAVAATAGLALLVLGFGLAFA